MWKIEAVPVAGAISCLCSQISRKGSEMCSYIVVVPYGECLGTGDKKDIREERTSFLWGLLKLSACAPYAWMSC